jgi:hypothetical protein
MRGFGVVLESGKLPQMKRNKLRLLEITGRNGALPLLPQEGEIGLGGHLCLAV